MKTLLIFCIAFFLSAFSAPTIHELNASGHVCVYSTPPNFSFNIPMKQAATSAAQNKFDRMCIAVGRNSSIYKFYSVPGFVGIAYAYIGTREIGYDPYMLNQIDQQGNGWAGFSVIAHELGHQIIGANELKADEYSGYILGLMGATLSDAQLAISMIGSPNPTPSHPDKYTRMEWIKKGWQKGKNHVAF